MVLIICEWIYIYAYNGLTLWENSLARQQYKLVTVYA